MGIRDDDEFPFVDVNGLERRVPANEGEGAEVEDAEKRDESRFRVEVVG